MWINLERLECANVVTGWLRGAANVLWASGGIVLEFFISPRMRSPIHFFVIGVFPACNSCCLLIAKLALTTLGPERLGCGQFLR